MGDDEELRARIDAQLASRRAAARPPNRDRSGRGTQDGDPGAAAAAPHSLEPVRPWLTGEPTSIDPDESDDGVESSDHADSSTTLGPARPWLSRPPSGGPPANEVGGPPDKRGVAAAGGPSATDPPSPPDSASRAPLQPVRPWLHRPVKAQPDQAPPGAARADRPGRPEPRPLTGRLEPTFDEPPAVGPPIESLDDSTAPPQPARVLREHWAREREALIAERAALMAEREALLAERATLSGLRESTPAADPDTEPPARKHGWLGRRRAAAVPPDAGTDRAERPPLATPPAATPLLPGGPPTSLAGGPPLAARHAAAPGQSTAAELEPVSPFESFRTPAVVSTPIVEPPADYPDVADADPRVAADEHPDAPEHVDVDVEADEHGDARAGWSRRTLGWLLAPAELPEQRAEPLTEQTAPDEDDERVRAPEQPASGHEREPAATTVAAEQPPATPGSDLPRRLAAANAAAMARALASEAYDFPDDDDDDADVPQERRATAAFVRPSSPRPAGIAREREEEPPKSAPLVTGTAFAKRNSSPTEIDADEPAPAAAKRHRVPLRGAIRLLVVVVIAAVIATLLRTYVVAPYFIPSASMEPTLHGCSGCNDDHVLVDKLSYKMHAIHRGDVVVFHRPQAWQVTEKVLIKRVIGLPGDTLTARNGIVFVDGLALQEPYLDKACQSGTTNFPTKPVTVPDGEAYVMGDNRCDSSDSRRFGAIADSTVIGRAFLIIWPLGRLHWL